MLTLHSFLQTVCRFVKTLAAKVTKKMYRCAAVLTTGFAVVTVVTLTSSGFGGGGKSAIPAFAETVPGKEEILSLEEAEETELITEAKIQVGLTDSRRDGQLLVGNLLAKSVQQKQEQQEVVHAEIEKVKKEILMQAEAKAEEAARKKKMVSYSEKDYEVLLRIVQAEAGVCDEKGKILVANVILNRVRNKQFPNTITNVVYQKSQFSPVSNGTINTVKVSQETMECVNRALAGEDYSKGAMYFMYRGGSRAHAVDWFDSRLTFMFQHGNHEFFK